MQRQRKSPELLHHARSLRKNSTPGERKLWEALQEAQKITGIRFHRQKPINYYIADFYSPALRCIIEIDGMSHDGKTEKDQRREDYLKGLGLVVLRFSESDARMNAEAIVETVFAHFERPLR